MISNDKVFSGWALLPKGKSCDTVTAGCLVLEGGAFRGVYTSGVLDALLEEGINMQTVIGVSAGGLNGLNYCAGQIGRAARINLRYRHDGRYVGPKNLLVKGGVIGFDFVINGLMEEEPFDMERFMDGRRDFVVCATNVLTGEPAFFSKHGDADIFKAAAASASMPFVSRPVEIDGIPYLDGGCSNKIPYQWALDQGFEKILVVRTRPLGFTKGEESDFAKDMIGTFYRSSPDFAKCLADSNGNYDRQNAEIDRLHRRGRLYSLQPGRPVTISRLEGDMEKLGELYYMGYHDARAKMKEIKAYLGLDSETKPAEAAV